MFEGYEELNTQDVERMQEVIRTLLAQTFLPERKYDKNTDEWCWTVCMISVTGIWNFWRSICGCRDKTLSGYGAWHHLFRGSRRNRWETAETCDHLSAAVKTDLWWKNGGCFFQCQCNNDVWRIKWKSGRIPSHQGTVIDDGDQKSVCHSEKYQMVEFLDVFDEQLEIRGSWSIRVSI